jgi:hypothetical protein
VHPRPMPPQRAHSTRPRSRSQSSCASCSPRPGFRLWSPGCRRTSWTRRQLPS